MSAAGRSSGVTASARGSRQRGVGLIEVLVAMLVLSIGFLAAGAMQVHAMRANQDAYHDSQAEMLLADMVDRMRGNPAGVRAGHYAIASTATLAIDTGTCLASACSPAALAARDLSVWATHLEPDVAGVLPRLPPSGTNAPAFGSIVAGADGVFTLTLAWQSFIDGELVDRRATVNFVP